MVRRGRYLARLAREVPAGRRPPRGAQGNDHNGNDHDDNGTYNRTFLTRSEPDISTLP